MYGISRNLTTSPRAVRRTLRPDRKNFITSGDAGFMIPIAHVPILREDSVQSGRVTASFTMGETADMLVNGVNAKVEVHFIPKVAFKRFRGMESFNRSYAKIPETEDGDDVIPFYSTSVSGEANELYRALGVHTDGVTEVNMDLIESYNVLVNWQRAMRSPSLPQRGFGDSTLARCFWQNTQLSEVVPSFDSQQIHGDVPIEIASGGLMPVQGLGTAPAAAFTEQTRRETDGEEHTQNYTDSSWIAESNIQAGFPAVYAEMQAEGITLSLSSIELARKTQAFATIRSRYQSLSEDHLIDMLMQGLRIPDAQLQEPILLGQGSTLFGFNQRYASDFENLEKSMTEGLTSVSLNVRMPPSQCGGVILVTAAITPEQLYERQKDFWIYNTDQEDLPNATQDELDPEKVEIFKNDGVDVRHSVDGVFGYRPLNAAWVRDAPAIGGKFMRFEPDAPWDENRNRFWAAETVDPTLTEDFYLCTDLPKTIFADANVDSFEIRGSCDFVLAGNTVLGSGLREATDDYEKLLESVDQDRIDQEAAVEEAAEIEAAAAAEIAEAEAAAAAAAAAAEEDE